MSETTLNLETLAAFNLSDRTDRLVLADLLTDHGRDSEARILREKYGAPELYGDRILTYYQAEQRRREARLAEERRLAAIEAAALAEAHRRVVSADYALLRAQSAAAYAERRVSDGYWALLHARMLERHIGYVEVIVLSAMQRGTPPAGVIWVRPSSGGRWGKSRAEKKGRPLTRTELEALANARS